MDILKAKTIKEMIDKRYYKLDYDIFKKIIKKNKNLYDSEKVFLKIIYQFNFSWDIEVEFFLVAYSFELTKKEIYGALLTINPQKNQIVTSQDLKDLFYDGEKMFDACEINDIAFLFKR